MSTFADQTLKHGRVDEALQQLQERVRNDPSNAKYRTFLFQLLCVNGQWERALTQLKVVGEMDASALAMVHTYREALQCEAFRARVFAGESAPVVFGKPEPWVALMLEALHCSADGRHAQAADLRARAFEEAPATSGTADGKPFEWIADADPRIGPMLEAVVNGRYYWISFQNLRTIAIEEPSDLRDVVWMPAQLTWANGGEAVALLPTRYPGSEASDDNLVRLARKTEWTELAEDTFVGRGQRMLATDADEYPLMDLRRVELRCPEAPSEGRAAGDTAG